MRLKVRPTYLSALAVAIALSGTAIVWRPQVEPLPGMPIMMPGPPPRVVEGRIERNRTLEATLLDYDVPLEMARRITDLVKPVFDVRKLRFGNIFKIEQEPTGDLRAFEYKIDDQRILKVGRESGDFEARVETLEFDSKEETVTAEIRSSLFAALDDTPKGETLAMELAEVFAWDLDFNSDIHPGDRIRIVVESLYHDGKFVKHGRIQAAELINKRRTYRAFLFRNAYYDGKGGALKRSLLKSPLKFTRISSRFSASRRHPILHTTRAHLAVDYAAPTGSPVVAVANGKVVSSGWNGGLGNYVEIQHASGMRTGYAHLSRIADSARRGISIKQGELVGLVGSTGLATGPHLHFIMLRNGRPVNPLPIKAEPAAPIAATLKPEFLKYVAMRENQLGILSASR